MAWAGLRWRRVIEGRRRGGGGRRRGWLRDGSNRTREWDVRLLSDVTVDLSELSRAQAGVLRLDLTPLSLSDLVSDALSAATPVAEARGVHLAGLVVGPATAVEGSAPVLSPLHISEPTSPY